MTTPEIEELKRLVAERYAQGLHTSTDFDAFSVHLKCRHGLEISTSTLKRLWNYVGDTHKPRYTTLDALAQYLGHDCFESFARWLKTSGQYDSSFFQAPQLTSMQLEENDMIEIGWRPNRLLRLCYQGNNTYEVKESLNSKLVSGDRFVAACIIRNEPLYLPYVERDGEHTPPFVAGRNGGLTTVQRIAE